MVMWTLYYFLVMKCVVCKHYHNYLHGKVLIGKEYYFNLLYYDLAAGNKENIQDRCATRLSADSQRQLHRQRWEPTVSCSTYLDAFSSKVRKIVQLC